jgi:hypothetical protein
MSKESTVKCKVCGRFMRRLKLLERVRLEAQCGLIRTHICKKETITYADGFIEHK